jgi:hypothetical protein
MGCFNAAILPGKDEAQKPTSVTFEGDAQKQRVDH